MQHAGGEKKQQRFLALFFSFVLLAVCYFCPIVQRSFFLFVSVVRGSSGDVNGS